MFRENMWDKFKKIDWGEIVKDHAQTGKYVHTFAGETAGLEGWHIKGILWQGISVFRELSGLNRKHWIKRKIKGHLGGSVN